MGAESIFLRHPLIMPSRGILFPLPPDSPLIRPRMCLDILEFLSTLGGQLCVHLEQAACPNIKISRSTIR
jgi:hypothetical protein